MKKTSLAFSMIEILIGIFIFSLGVSAIYVLISSTINLNEYNKNQIIASNLAREQIELIRNIRDSNYKTYHKWNQKGPNLDYRDINNYFSTGSFYKIENDYSETALFPIKVQNISNGFGEGKSKLNGAMLNYNLCVDSESKYTYDCVTSGNRRTRFYRYLKIDEVKYNSGGVNKVVKDAYKVKSKVIWYIRGYHEFELDTIITDWKRL